MDKILRFTNTLNIISIFIKATSLPDTCVLNHNNFHKVPFLTGVHCALLLFTLTANAKYAMPQMHSVMHVCNLLTTDRQHTNVNV